MSHIIAARTHQLGLDAARHAAERIAADLAQKYALQSNWSGNRLAFSGMGVQGWLDVSATDLRLDIELSFLLSAFHAAIEQGVQSKLDEVL